VSFIVELIVSGVLYATLTQSIDLTGHDAAVAASDAKLVALGIREPASAVSPARAAIEDSV